MFLHLTKEEEPNDSPSEEIMEEQEPTIFDPKSFLESLFNSRQAEIEVLLHNNASYNQNITRNHEKENDESEIDYKYKPDVYFVIGAVSFIILLVLCVAIYKAFVMLKISLNDGIDDTVPVENNRNNQRQNQENIQSVASGQFLNGFRQFQANLANVSATLRSRASIKSEDDLPPPYEAQISPDRAQQLQQSPPPYHVAIAIEMTNEENSDNNHDQNPDNMNSDSNYPSSSHEDSEADHDETDSKVNFAAKKVPVRLCSSSSSTKANK